MKKNNNMCLAILVMLALFLMYQLFSKNTKTVGGDNHAPITNAENAENMEDGNVIESDSELDVDSNTELDFNDPDYRNYEPVLNENEDTVVNEVENEIQDNVVNNEEEKMPEDQVEEAPKDTYNITGLEDSDAYFMLNTNEVSNNATTKNNKLNPSELLPADSKNMEGNNFLTASLSKNEQIIGVPTQTQRSRKNYDLRSAPPNPQVEVSPWNMSTMEPDTGRLTFEIGQSHCPPCE